MHKKIFPLLAFIALFHAKGHGQEVYKQSSAPVETRVAD